MPLVVPIRPNLLYQLTSTGKQETELGDSLQYNAAVVWSPAPQTHDDHAHSHSDQNWLLVLELNGEWRGKTQVDKEKDRNTGGNAIFATAGRRWSIGDWSTQIALAAPVLKDFNGIQSELNWRFSSEIAFAF
jgi:hypothetical protein